MKDARDTIEERERERERESMDRSLQTELGPASVSFSLRSAISINDF